MKVLKVIGLIILIIIIILFIALPTEIKVEKDIVINQKIDIVFQRVNILNEWENWSPWQKLDADIKNSYSGPESGVGAENSFISENQDVGVGKQRILVSNENQNISVGIFLEGMSSENEPTLVTNFNFQKISETHTKVFWKVSDTVSKFSFYRLIIPFINITLDEMFKNGLEDLKKYSEEYHEKIVDVELSEGIKPRFTLITLKDTTETNIELIKKSMGSKFIKLVEYVQKNKLNSDRLPFTFKHKFDPENNQAIYEYGLPILNKEDKAKVSDEFNILEIGGNYCVSATHTGPLKTINQAHKGIEKYMQLREYELDGTAYQYHLTDPEEVNEWDMKSIIVYPVKKKDK